MRLLIRATVSVALLLAASQATADNGRVATKSISIKIDPVRTDQKLLETIASASKNQPVAVSSPQKLGELVKSYCGEVDPAFYQLLGLVNKDLVATPDAEIAADTVINFPVCIPKPALQVTKQTIEKDDTIWKYYASARNSLDWAPEINKTATEYLAKAITSSSSGETAVMFDEAESKFVGPSGTAFSYRDLYAALNGQDTPVTGRDAYVPTGAPRWISIIPSEEIAGSTEKLEEVNVALANASSTVGTPDAADIFQHVVALNASCKPFQPDENTKNELSRILLEVGTAVKKKNWRLKDVRVSLIDSGIVETPGAIVSPEKLAKQPINLGDMSGLDPQYYMPVTAQNINAIRDHGTRVGSIILGGRSFYETVDQIGFSIQLVPTRMYEAIRQTLIKDNGEPVLQDGHIAQATIGQLQNERVIATLDEDSADIYNLSLGRHEPMRFFTDHFGPSKRTLYVVAAGNNGVNLADGLNAFYPASYGGDGDGRDNLITVASVDGDDQLSSFSNYGVGVVDLAAPGCDVPSQGYDFDLKAPVYEGATGTSFAAPQVTFVASLLKSIYPEVSAREIKIRILQSADLVDTLTNRIVDGRVLNVRKAMSVFWDVVETKDADGTTKLHRGKLSARPDPEVFCQDLTLQAKSRLLKVRFGFDGDHDDASKNLVYFLDGASSFRRRVCQAKQSDVVLTSPEGVEERLSAASLRDLILTQEK